MGRLRQGILGGVSGKVGNGGTQAERRCTKRDKREIVTYCFCDFAAAVEGSNGGED